MKMKRKVKVYLDTSVISALFDVKNPERKSLTEAFLKEIESFEPFISEITVAEIERTPDPLLQSKMKEVVSQFSVLPLTDDVEWLANEYVRYGAVPESYPEDAYHIAIAVVNEIDFLLSWNFKHIVRRKTRDIVKMVNTLNRFRQIEIMTPAELL
jgi:predicted nucleic acid-binding protein